MMSEIRSTNSHPIPASACFCCGLRRASWYLLLGGMCSEDDRLFQPFQQVDSRRTRQTAGSGLGLAISRQLVGRMHGRIGVDRASDVGSVFWFEPRNGSSLLM